MPSDRRETLKLIREDVFTDAASLDGMPFDGMTVGTMFGNLLAMVGGLVSVIETLIPEDMEEAR